MAHNLSFEQAPPLSVPLRFFLTAPLFGLLAAVLLLWLGEPVLATRWTPGALAVTHLLTAGFMLQAMLGALLQFLPVAAGANIWRPKLVANLVHPCVTSATLFLVAGFLQPQSDWFLLAGLLFALGLGSFILVVGHALLTTPARSATLHSLRLALLGLAMTLLLGLGLLAGLRPASGLLTATGWSLPQLLDVHVAWGLGGWALMLVMAVSYLVVPMFLLTPGYEARLARGLPYGLLLVLLLWSVLVLGGQVMAVWHDVLICSGLTLAAIYAGYTLHLQQRRRRRVIDTTFMFWRLAMLAVLALCASWLLLRAGSLPPHPGAMLWLGSLALFGVFVSVISGMMYKIIPFMIWLHLQRLPKLSQVPPNMKQMIPETSMRPQFHAHLAATLLILLSVVWPVLLPLAALFLGLSFVWLGWNLLRAVRIYQNFKWAQTA